MLYFKNRNKRQTAQIYTFTGGTLPSTTLSFIIATDSWHIFALALNALLYDNYIFVWEVTQGIIYQQ